MFQKRRNFFVVRLLHEVEKADDVVLREEVLLGHGKAFAGEQVVIEALALRPRTWDDHECLFGRPRKVTGDARRKDPAGVCDRVIEEVVVVENFWTRESSVDTRSS